MAGFNMTHFKPIKITLLNRGKLKKQLKRRIAHQEKLIQAHQDKIDRYARGIAYINAGGRTFDVDLYFGVDE